MNVQNALAGTLQTLLANSFYSIDHRAYSVLINPRSVNFLELNATDTQKMSDNECKRKAGNELAQLDIAKSVD